MTRTNTRSHVADPRLAFLRRCDRSNEEGTGDETDAARVVLAVGRSLLIGLPRTLVSRFGTVSGVRLNLRAPENTSGGQVTGQLLAATADGRPGEPLEDGTLSPVQVSDVVARWYTLPFAAPGPPIPSPEPAGAGLRDRQERFVAAWLELQPGYGEVECSLTAGSPSDVLDPGGPLRQAVVRWGDGWVDRHPGDRSAARRRTSGRVARPRPLDRGDDVAGGRHA